MAFTLPGTSSNWIYIALVLLLCFTLSKQSRFSVQLDPNVRTCFYEMLNVTESFGINYELIPDATGMNSGKKTVDLEIFGPLGNVVYADRDKREGTIYYNPTTDGRHNYCFTSKHLVRPTINILGGHPADSGVPSHMRGEDDNVEESLKQLLLGLRAVRDEQESMLMREKAHNATCQSTHSRVFWWSVLEYAMLLGVSGFQVYYLKKFFEVKKSI